MLEAFLHCTGCPPIHGSCVHERNNFCIMGPAFLQRSKVMDKTNKTTIWQSKARASHLLSFPPQDCVSLFFFGLKQSGRQQLRHSTSLHFPLRICIFGWFPRGFGIPACAESKSKPRLPLWP